MKRLNVEVTDSLKRKIDQLPHGMIKVVVNVVLEQTMERLSQDDGELMRKIISQYKNIKDQEEKENEVERFEA